MPKKWIFIAAAIIILAAGGFWLYDWVLGEPLEASEPISAVPVEIETQPTAEMLAPTIEVTPEVEIVEDPTPEPTLEEILNPDPTSQFAEGYTILTIVSEESEARFNIYELLNGNDKDVIGKTNQIAGEIAINPEDLSQTQFGEIRVNARTLVTDENRRNNAIRNRILFTDQYEFIIFTPVRLSGLSGAGEIGGLYDFQITGDLTIRDITQEVTFDIQIQVESDSRITGTASTTITRSEYEISIPSVPFVANVADEFNLEVDFVLVPVER